MGVPTAIGLLEHRNSIEPLVDYISSEHVEILSLGGSILKKKLALNGVGVSISVWPDEPFEGFESLTLKVIRACDGIVQVKACAKSSMASLMFYFDFIKQKVHTSIEESGAVSVEDGGSGQLEIAYLRYFCAVICNGTIELRLSNGGILTCEVVIPVNIDIGGSVKAAEARIDNLAAYL